MDSTTTLTDESEALIERLAAKLAESMAVEFEHVLTRARPTIPIQIDLWDFETIASYLKRDRDYVRDTLAKDPGFPLPIRLPSRGHGRGSQALFKASEIIAWAESLRQHAPGRPRKVRSL